MAGSPADPYPSWHCWEGVLSCPFFPCIFGLLVMSITINQELVSLVSSCGNGRMEFYWPNGAEVVTVTNGRRREVYSIEEAHELFDQLLFRFHWR